MRSSRASGAPAGRGRARDPSIDTRLLETAARHLAAYGYEAMSVAAVAEEAGTTRQALYRRWPGKADLGAAAVTALADRATVCETADPFVDLVAELADFRQGVSRPGRLSLVGTMLQDSVETVVRARYQSRVIAPRRSRLRLIFERAQRLGLIAPDADLEVAVTMCTGSWYARALAGTAPPRHWPERVAGLVWRAVGGAPPPINQTLVLAGVDGDSRRAEDPQHAATAVIGAGADGRAEANRS